MQYPTAKNLVRILLSIAFTLFKSMATYPHHADTFFESIILTTMPMIFTLLQYRNRGNVIASWNDSKSIGSAIIAAWPCPFTTVSQQF